MNSDIASACAWTPADRHTQQTNIALNEFDAALEQAKADYDWRLPVNTLVTASLLKARRIKARKRLTEMNIAICRVGAQLARIEGEA